MVAKGVICNKAKKDLELASGRIEASPNEEAFETDMKKIEDMTHKASTMSDLIEVMRRPVRDLDEAMLTITASSLILKRFMLCHVMSVRFMPLLFCSVLVCSILFYLFYFV